MNTFTFSSELLRMLACFPTVSEPPFEEQAPKEKAKANVV
jgi:hypothetical protein